MNDISEHPAYSKNVLELVTVANAYCLTMEKLESTKKSWLIDYLQKVFPLLYLKISLIPVIDVQNPEANERFFTMEEWEFLFNQLRKKFADDDDFWFIDQAATHNDPVKGSIAECLTDIYQDLKDFLTLYQKNSLDAKENAVYEIRESFEKRWGYLLVNAHKTLHYLIMSNRLPEEIEEKSGLF
jgi:hypothetical protein